jgi:hypothetical protein
MKNQLFIVCKGNPSVDDGVCATEIYEDASQTIIACRGEADPVLLTLLNGLRSCHHW